jgi:lipid II:glycine glycyltransferase (peptidoglycan interpeptide bridge formation enzyme)
MSDFINITDSNKDGYNKVVGHPLQSYEWGEFRKKTGVKVIRRGLVRNRKMVDGFTLTIHKIPRTGFNIGYLPKGNRPTTDLIEELKRIWSENNCIFIQLEPNIKISNFKFQISNFGLKPAAHPLFTKYTFVLNLGPSEEEWNRSNIILNS